MSLTVPLTSPASMKSPSSNGRVSRMVMPLMALDRQFCTESDKARPSRLNTASSAVTLKPRLSATMRMAINSSAILSTLRMNRLRLSDRRECAEMRRAIRMMIQMTSMQITSVMAEVMSFSSVRLPRLKPMALFTSSMLSFVDSSAF